MSDLGEPMTTDYCVECGESPESGSHLPHGHEYVDPRAARPELTAGISEDQVAACAEMFAGAPFGRVEMLAELRVPPVGQVASAAFSAGRIDVTNVAIDDVGSFRVVVTRGLGNLSPDDRYRILERAAELMMARARKELGR